MVTYFLQMFVVKSNSMYKLAVVDDHLLFRNMLLKILYDAGTFEIVFNCDNGPDFIRQMELAEKIPDFVILDIQMPVMNGKELAAILKEKFPDLVIIVLSVINHQHTVNNLIEIGVNGIISKNVSIEVLLSSIQKILNGSFVIVGPGLDTMTIKQSVKLTMDKYSGTTLTKKQIQFLKLCASTNLSYKMIAGKMNISPNTANRYREELFRKLNINNRMGAMLFAIQNGMVTI